MKQRCGWLVCLLPAVLGLVLHATPVRAEGSVFYGGYGADHTTCGSSALPCGTYRYTYHRACNLSENRQDTYHVYHVYNGYAGSCDMVGGSGLEPRAYTLNWQGYFVSMVLPGVLCFGLTFAGTRLRRRKHR
jgi:hypothetical protein